MLEDESEECRLLFLLFLDFFFFDFFSLFTLRLFGDPGSCLIARIGSLSGSLKPSVSTSDLIVAFAASLLISSGGICGLGAHPSMYSCRVSSSILSLSFGGL